MTTYNELIDSTLMYLNGFTTLQDQATYLTEDVAADTLGVPVADTAAISRGVIEIGNELIWVDQSNSTSGLLTVPPYGRGYRGTTATTHSSGTRVVSSPLFPRVLVARAINETIRSVYPSLWGIGETTFTANPAITTYQLPAGATNVLQITWQSIGPSKEWIPVRTWRIDKHASTSVFASGVSLNIYDSIVPGRTVKVVYSKQPTVLANDGDDYTAVTGLPASTEDVVRLGAAYRMVPFFDAPHLSGMSAEADFAANMRPVGGASTLGKYLMQLYQMRLSEESNKLQELFPIRSHYTR